MSVFVTSEAAEKELVWKFFGRKGEGVFVEVGANDPVAGSQSWLLEQNGWRGVLVEPQASCCEKLRAVRKNSQVFQVACSGPDLEGEAELLLAAENGSSALQKQRDTHGTHFVGVERVTVTTLDKVLREAGISRIDFLSMDVEGHEIEVMRGFSFEVFRPALILIEDGAKLVKRTTLNNWYVPRETRFRDASLIERLALIRKMFLGLPFRKIRLYLRRRKAKS